MLSSKSETDQKVSESQDQTDPVLKPASEPVNPNVGGFSLQNGQNITYAFKESTNRCYSKPANIFLNIERPPFIVLGEYPKHRLLHFSRYINRIETFRTWPKTCQNGFLYTGHGDKVYCPKCQVMLIEWESYDKPMEEHRRHSPMCDFVKMITPYL